MARDQRRLAAMGKDLEFVETRLQRNPSAAEREVLARIKAHLENEGVVAEAGLTPEELHLIESHAFVTAKPMVVAEPADSAAFDDLLVRAVSSSGYIVTVGSESHAWLIRKGATTQEAAGAIHTDIHKGFIRGEIIGYDDFVAAGGETQAKHANKMRIETESYVMQDYDVAPLRSSDR